MTADVSARQKSRNWCIIFAPMRMTAENLERLRAYAASGRIVVFDTETTGCRNYDEICQIGAAEYVNGTLTRTLNLYLNPTCEMNPQAEAVHGLSLDFLACHGLDPVEGLHRFFDFLGADALLVAHNSRFDLGMLARECAKFDVAFEPAGIELCDSLALARQLRPDLKSHALGNLVAALGVAGTNSHDALDDTLACANVFFTLLAADADA